MLCCVVSRFVHPTSCSLLFPVCDECILRSVGTRHSHGGTVGRAAQRPLRPGKQIQCGSFRYVSGAICTSTLNSLIQLTDRVRIERSESMRAASHAILGQQPDCLKRRAGLCLVACFTCMYLQTFSCPLVPYDPMMCF